LVGAGNAGCRAFVEQFREPDVQIGFLWGGFTMGQCLSMPIVLLGLALLFYALKTPKESN
jgi:phosphatidylglycerol:prolipoprotein diacylglycerol transferase